MAQSMASIVLPSPPSWYPGHMRQFVKMLPALLSRTDVVLELRDARLPLTSINGTFEGVLQKWRQERFKLADAFTAAGQRPADGSMGPSLRGHSSLVCQRIVVMNKRDLVADWGIKPYQKAMAARFPDQHIIFASWNKPKDVKNLHEVIVNIARENAHVSNELNVLVVGMPNVGKSTLLNALRNKGISGPTPKALRTSANPGLTRALSTRLKLSQDPLVYSFDSPGVMLPFLGKGDLGAERGIKLALIAGIREGFYTADTLVQYLLYRLNLLNPEAPAYLSVLPPGTEPTDDAHAFLDILARRLGMLKRGGGRDIDRAAVWFVRWWREEGCALSANAPLLAGHESQEAGAENVLDPGRRPPYASGTESDSSRPLPTSVPAGKFPSASASLRGGWGFDFQWDLSGTMCSHGAVLTTDSAETAVEQEMGRIIDAHMQRVQDEEASGGAVSDTQHKKREKEAARAKREKRVRELLAARRAGGGKR